MRQDSVGDHIHHAEPVCGGALELHKIASGGYPGQAAIPLSLLIVVVEDHDHTLRCPAQPSCSGLGFDVPSFASHVLCLLLEPIAPVPCKTLTGEYSPA